MFFKLSVKNVLKSFSNYTLYFLTLTFGVCVFYIFNSIEAQKAMMHISESVYEIMRTITRLMNVISVFISFILGFLIVYANNFLVKRRKREFGIYMTLGMKKGRIARILITETFIIGVFSLATGLCAGIFLSQGLSVITAKLFEANMKGFTFVFSLDAFIKTIIYFGIIFIIAIAASTLTMSKYKLITLINSLRQNEKHRIRNPVATVILFILAVGCIGTAYALVLKNGIINFDERLLFECILGAIGTFLFFASLSGFLLKAVQSNKRLYYNKLNMFILRQINNRINTAYISMSFICLMLFVTIGVFSTAIGMTSVLNRGLRQSAAFDISVKTMGDVDIPSQLSQGGIDLSEYTDAPVQYKVYRNTDSPLNMNVIFEKNEDLLSPDVLEVVRNRYYNSPIFFITQSDFNRLMALQNKESIDLSQNKVALAVQHMFADADIEDFVNGYMARENTIEIGGVSYSVYPKAVTDGLVNNNYDLFTLIVPDGLTSQGEIYRSVLCFNCTGDPVAKQDEFMNKLYSLMGQSKLTIWGDSRNEILAQMGGSKAIVSFVGIYVGLVFLMTSAAVLALQQLSEAADNRQRYAVLQKIGADNRLLSSAIFKQTAIYFLVPLAVACVHSIVGLKVANDAIRNAGSLNAGLNTVITAAAVLAVYGTYFLATYVGNRNIILKGNPNIS